MYYNSMNKFLFYYGGDACIEVMSYLLDTNKASIKDEYYIVDPLIKSKNKKNLISKYKKLFFKKNLKEIKRLHFKGVYITSGIPVLRSKALIEIKKNQLKLSSIIHPTSYVSDTAKISDGCILAPFTLVAPYAKISANCFLNSYSSVGHHCKIGHSNVFSPYSTLNGNCTTGNKNFFGTGAIINPGVKIFNNCKISSGSILRKNMYHNSFAHGNPAIIKKIF